MPSPSSKKKVVSFYTEEDLHLIRDNPHILGWIAGMKDLTPLHSEWIKYIWTSPKSRALMAHRYSFKSSAIVYIGSVWYLLFNPEDRIAIVRKTHNDACEGVGAITKIMQQPEIRELFRFAHGEYPEFTKKRIDAIDFTFKRSKTPEGSISGFGLNSQFTGKHFDFILCDDISTLDDRLSKAEREFTMAIWRELSTNIIGPGKLCCYVGTPWTAEGVESIIPTPKKYSIKECNILSPEQIEEKRAGTTPALFSVNYLLEYMSSEEQIFKDPQWEDWQYTGIETTYAHVDAAYGGKDYNALTICARRKDGKLQSVGFLYPGSIADRIEDIKEKCKLYKVKKIYVENQSDKGWTLSMLRHAGLNAHGYDENMKKEHKIATFGLELWGTTVWDSATDGMYLSQITDWTEELGKGHDDAPDSFSSLVRMKYSKKGASGERWRW